LGHYVAGWNPVAPTLKTLDQQIATIEQINR